MSSPVEIGILTTDTDLVIRSWDEWLAAATGIAPEAACGTPLAEIAPAVAGALRPRFEDTLRSGSVHVLSPALHHFLIPCAPRQPSRQFARMQQRVHIGPLLAGERIVGTMITIADVTSRVEAERDLAIGLTSADPEERRHASERLASAPQVESLEPFAPALRADDWKVRQATVHGLARAANTDVLHAVVDTLRKNHRNFNALSSALKLLAMSEVPITEPLALLLEDDDADLRIQAALALGEQQDPAAAAALIGALSDADENVRFHAIEALGRLRAVEAVEPLAAVAEQGDFFLSFAAVDALSQISDPTVAPRLAPLLADANIREAVATALGTLGDEQSIAPLVTSLNASGESAAAIASALVAIERRQEQQFGEGARISTRVRESVDAAGERHLLGALRSAEGATLAALVRLLGWLRRDTAAPELVTLLGRDDARDEIIEALVRHGERIVEPVVAQLASDDDAVRAAAIATLGRLGSRRATSALLPLLEESADVVIPTAGALAKIGDPAAFDALLDVVSHRDPAVRQSVVGALNSIGHPEMPARIAALLRSPDPMARESAVRIAGYFGYAETADALFACAADEVEAVRVAALEHLPFLDDPRTLGALATALAQDAPRARAAAARALGRLGEAEAHDALVAALADEDAWVRYYAVRSAAELRDRAAVPALISMATADPAAQVRIAALDALGATGDHRAHDVLTGFSADADDNVAAAALAALARVGTGAALPSLLEAARSTSEARRRAAVDGLGRDATPPAVEALRWLAGADDGRTAELAITALGQAAAASSEGGDAAARALVDLLGDDRRAEHAAGVLCRLRADRLSVLQDALQHPQVTVRQRAVSTLGRFTAADPAPVLMQALDDEKPAVREAAILQLARLGTRNINGRFAEIARTDPSKHVRRAAAAAMARLRQPGPA